MKSVCKNCNHPIYGYKMPYSHKWTWDHYRIKPGQKHGTAREKCFLCECQNPTPNEVVK